MRSALHRSSFIGWPASKALIATSCVRALGKILQPTGNVADCLPFDLRNFGAHLLDREEASVIRHNVWPWCAGELDAECSAS